MSDAYADIGSAEAAALYAEAVAIGQTFKLYHRDGSAVTLYAIIDDQNLGYEYPQSMRLAESGEILLKIPNQDNFAAAIAGFEKPIQAGDKIEYIVGSGRYFIVEDVKLLANGYIYQVRATERRTLTLGTKS